LEAVTSRSKVVGTGDGWDIDNVDSTSCKETVYLEGIDANEIVETPILCEDIRDGIGGLPTYLTRGDVGFGKFGFEEGSEEKEDGGVIVHADF
jgi:hypothetical protein